MFREFLYGTWLPWMRAVSHIDLNANMNLTFSRYNDTGQHAMPLFRPSTASIPSFAYL